MGSAQSKAAQLIETYELSSMGAELKRAWLGENGQRQSLRDLADRFNQALLVAAIRDTGMGVTDVSRGDFRLLAGPAGRRRCRRRARHR
ncbi:rod-determining factor RdfA [Haloarcula sp. NS06]|uniref:rod-determining factor RdfA n=2 Tax=unclassified Haloarcula TaxID=2624677 RepID=UPI0027B3600A|nr:rod-determining factor RdfA [Haloarcula sp. H-GB4]MDQ2074379.1 hypothetical protein [Haloarcula sp. H-GB4]